MVILILKCLSGFLSFFSGYLVLCGFPVLRFFFLFRPCVLLSSFALFNCFGEFVYFWCSRGRIGKRSLFVLCKGRDDGKEGGGNTSKAYV